MDFLYLRRNEKNGKWKASARLDAELELDDWIRIIYSSCVCRSPEKIIVDDWE